MAYKRKTDWAWAQDHKYVVQAGGKPQPGVTTIIRQLDKPAIAKNYVRRALDGEDPYVTQTAKMELGTRVHAAAERIARGDRSWYETGHEEDDGYLAALYGFWNAHQPEPVAIEPILIFSDTWRGFGGRADLITPDTIIDYKTGGHFLVDPVLQLNAYSRCSQAVYDDDGGLCGSKLLPLPDMSLMVVYLNDDGTYLTVDVPNSDEHFATFLSLRKVYAGVKAIQAWERQIKKGLQ